MSRLLFTLTLLLGVSIKPKLNVKECIIGALSYGQLGNAANYRYKYG
jgi:hypothetical protein